MKRLSLSKIRQALYYRRYEADEAIEGRLPTEIPIPPLLWELSRQETDSWLRGYRQCCRDVLEMFGEKDSLPDEVEKVKCAAENCDNTFVPYKSGKKQRFCSDRCYKRVYMRKRRHKALDNTR
jgi:hypothetical protein